MVITIHNRSNAFRLATATILVLSLLLLSGCKHDDPYSDKVGIVVSILPQAEWVNAIGGDMVDVSVMIPPGASPHVYEPTASQMKALANAKIYIAAGSGIEFEISFLSELLDINPDILLVDCSDGVELMHTTEQQHDDEHQSDHDHSYDPHIWLSLVNASTMATNIYNGIVAIDPENIDYYRQNLDTYLGELAQMHQSFQEGFANLNNRVFIIQHPSLGYFARDYNLTQIATEEGGSDATIQSMVHTIEQAKQNNVKIVFVSPQFPPNVAEAVAHEIEGKVEPLDTLAGNYKENMQHIFNIMHQAMESR
ncbi:MAG: zinc ABC transporter substrate-binding protein [Dehalococcoidales bacterium]|nr:zinc ABC transporter substrate-binding protein [Dehalococcoidales bacterium]MDX9985850.1 zinc ABC transporter substrate-binding protein [Dehalococcoidales bacterium]